MPIHLYGGEAGAAPRIPSYVWCYQYVILLLWRHIFRVICELAVGSFTIIMCIEALNLIRTTEAAPKSL